MINTQLKSAHEEAASIRFLALYNDLNNSDLCFARLGDPSKKEPDCICSGDTAIELVGAYDNQYQARKIWNDARGKVNNEKPEFKLVTFENLELEIANKLEKLNKNYYDGFTGKILLLCNLHSPLLTSSDFESFVARYTPFKVDGYFDRYFQEIWITWQPENSGKWSIRQLE